MRSYYDRIYKLSRRKCASSRTGESENTESHVAALSGVRAGRTPHFGAIIRRGPGGDGRRGARLRRSRIRRSGSEFRMSRKQGRQMQWRLGPLTGPASGREPVAKRARRDLDPFYVQIPGRMERSGTRHDSDGEARGRLRLAGSRAASTNQGTGL